MKATRDQQRAALKQVREQIEQVKATYEAAMKAFMKYDMEGCREALDRLNMEGDDLSRGIEQTSQLYF